MRFSVCMLTDLTIRGALYVEALLGHRPRWLALFLLQVPPLLLCFVCNEPDE